MSDEVSLSRPIPLELYERGIMVPQIPSLDELIDVAQSLPVDQKAALVQRLLGQNSALSVVFGNNQLSGQIIVQINTTDKAALGDILDAIASRIRTEKDDVS
jgi:hypothetical protein